MQVGVGTVGGRVAVAAALAAVLGGCAGSGDDGKRPVPPSASARGATAGGTAGTGTTAVRGGTVGPAGSACELPVRFAVAAHWKAEPVDAAKEPAPSAQSGDGDLGEALADALLRQGPVTMACEIDAKPAGSIGYLRVWTGRPGDADAGGVLRRFVAAEDGVGKERYHSFRTGGGLTAVEVEYSTTNRLVEETKKESAFAVGTPDGPVVLHLGGMDTVEHERMRPAYDLAKRTLTLS
ncbi:lipoprotein [Streptomyces sp. NPDC029080]|uniref:lipoprotein n=1 Tax=Streptomyces sp. NPDC029080 TaxID=3155017 RepID=UPI0033CC78B5